MRRMLYLLSFFQALPAFASDPERYHLGKRELELREKHYEILQEIGNEEKKIRSALKDGSLDRDEAFELVEKLQPLKDEKDFLNKSIQAIKQERRSGSNPRGMYRGASQKDIADQKSDGRIDDLELENL
jgi:hypothetical protein